MTQYGMSEEFGLIGLESITNRYLDGRPVMTCAESTAAKVDQVVMEILKDAYKKALDLIRANMDILDEAAQFLIEKETITGKEFWKFLMPRKNLLNRKRKISAKMLKAQRQMMRRYRNSRQKIWKIIHRICNILVIPCIDLTGFGYNDTIKFTVYRRCHEFCIDRMG